MKSSQRIEAIMSMTLLLGVLISLVLVLLGGSIYLIQYGQQNLQAELLQTYQIHVGQIWHNATYLTPLGLIELGLIILVATQIIRVALLVWFYTEEQDYRFIAISLFILLVLIYSFIWRN